MVFWAASIFLSSYIFRSCSSRSRLILSFSSSFRLSSSAYRFRCFSCSSRSCSSYNRRSFSSKMRRSRSSCSSFFLRSYSSICFRSSASLASRSCLACWAANFCSISSRLRSFSCSFCESCCSLSFLASASALAFSYSATKFACLISSNNFLSLAADALPAS